MSTVGKRRILFGLIETASSKKFIKLLWEFGKP